MAGGASLANSESAPGPDGSRPRNEPRGKHRRRWSLRRKSIVLAGFALLLLVDAGWVASRASSQLRAARDLLRGGASALETGRVGQAADSFAAARASAEAASSALRQPAAAIASVLPWVGDDVRAVRSLATASTYAAEAGSSLEGVATSVGWNGSGIPGYIDGGGIDVAAIAAAAPGIERAAASLERAREELRSVPTAGLLGPVEDAVRQAGTELDLRDAQIRRALTLTRLLPPFMGASGPRRYLLMSLNSSDPRGSGGYPGSFSVLTFQGGRMEVGPFTPTYKLGKVAPVPAPPGGAARYAPLGGLTHLIATTYSPDFPTSARLMLEMWQASGREPLDGVIAVDAVGLSYLLGTMAPVQVPGWPEPITAANVVRAVDHDTFLTLDPNQSNRWQGAIGAAVFGAILMKPPPGRAFVDALARAAAERHLQIYSTSAEEEAALRELGVSGSVALPANPLLVSWDGGVASRSGYFARKGIDLRVVLHPDGSADVTTTVTMTNGAPDGPPSILLGSGAPNDVPVGYFEAFTNVYMPVGAKDVRVKGSSLEIQARELGHPLLFGLFGAPAGGSATMSVSYRVPGALARSGGARVYALGVVPQPDIAPDQVSVSISWAGEGRLSSASPELSLSADGTAATYAGAPTSPITLQVETPPRV